VALLLNNSSAQIREEMLDRIIDRAPDIDPWHEPLVYRPVLPGRAAAKLARFVAHNLLEALRLRKDLEPDVLDEVRKVVAEGRPGRKTSAAEALEKVKKLGADGTLGEAAVSEMLKTRDREMTIAALAVLSGLKVDSMRTVISNRSAKGMASISWKAGLSAKFSEVLQKNLAPILTTDIIRAEGGRYALEDGDMEWQLDFIKDLS
jgi:hypothetical protein